MFARRLFAIANIVLDNVTPGFRDDAAVLRLGVLLFLIVVIDPDNKRVIARNPKLRERAHSGFIRPRVYDLNNLIKTYGCRSDFCKTRQNRSHAND